MSIKALSSPPPALGATAASVAPGKGLANAGGLDMDWDEDEEATHVLDREGPKAEGLVKPAAGNGRPAPGPSAKQTLVGLSAGPQASPGAASPPGARPPSLPPPPPSAPNNYARPPAPPGASPANSPPASMRPAAPPPATPPPPVSSPVPSTSATPGTNGSASSFPYQANTTPLAMPPRSTAPKAATPAKPDSGPALPPRPFPASRMMEATALVRPQPKPIGLYAMVALGVAVLIGTILFLMPHTGQVAINVADNKGGVVKGLQVSVDGKVQCDSAPCLVKDLPAGSHTVKVEAQGYDLPADKAVAIESGKAASVDFALTPVAASGGTGIKVTGSQPGEKLFIDDHEVGALPQEVHDLAPGSHRVRVAAGERYAAVEKTVSLAKDEFQDLGSVSLKVVKGRATVTLATPGAKVFLVSGSDRRELPTLPMSVDLDPSKQWSLVATKVGYADFTQPLTFDDGQAEKSFTVSLEPKTASPNVGSVTFAPPPVAYAPPPRVASEPAAPHHSAPKADPAEPPPPASGGGGEGTLNLNSIPSMQVLVDGKSIGNTPQIGVSVSAGTHRVSFVNPDEHFKKDVSVTVAAGETKKVHP
jgi:serine/threonine-protein kinase